MTIYFKNRVFNLMYLDKRKIKIPTPPLPLPYKGGERLPLPSADGNREGQGWGQYIFINSEKRGTTN